MAGIPEYIIDQIRDRADIVEVISRYIPLKKAGRNYKALCPFHHEKTPSFMVSPAKQIFHCFGCGTGGNVFNFLMKYERLEFPEAVRELAQKAGVVIPEEKKMSQGKSLLSERLHAINEISTRFYYENLARCSNTALPKRYLKSRGINSRTIETFSLGYAPNAWDGLCVYLKNKGFDISLLEKSGLVIKGKESKYFDRFRNKIIFPIFDIKNKVKGFGSRVLDDSQPKYMNSPDTFIYNKGNHLYGLNLSWEEIRNKNTVIIVEGYIDLLTPFQHGIRNIVASLGTSLTVEQIRLIKRYTDNVVMLFDADRAGENATIRSLDLIIDEDVKVKVAQLPEGYDPDSFVNKYGITQFKTLIDNAQDLFDYKLNLLLGRYDSKTLEGKAKIVEEMLPLISRIKNAIIRSGYLKKTAEVLSVNEHDLRAELKNVKPDYSYRYRPTIQLHQSVNANMAEKILAGLMLEDGVFIKTVRENLSYADFKDISIRKIVEKLFQLYDGDRNVGPSKLIDYFVSEESVCAYITELFAITENIVDKKKSLEDCIHWVRQSSLKEKLKDLCNEIKAAQECGDDSRVVELVIKYNNVVKELNKTNKT